jgi:molybdenum cofactor synthesis domain-containing protein
MSDDERTHYRPQADPRLDGESVAVITLSDRAAAGVYEDQSGALLEQRLQAMGAGRAPANCSRTASSPSLRPCARKPLAARPLVLCTGGTGFGPRDLAPEALAQVATRPVPGLAELFRSASSAHTPLAWLSRNTCALVGDNTLVLLLPGSPKAVAQGMDLLGPLLPHALAMMRGLPHA